MWNYLPILNAMINILVTIGLGGITGWLGIFKADTFVPNSIQFVFYVALPCLVLKGIGIGVDFYDKSFLWSYIMAFLVLRAIALVAGLALVLGSNWKAGQGVHGLGHVAVVWLTLTWISTVIMGVPISEAVFGDATKGQTYGLLAGISSFIFQLPLQLVFLECHALDTSESTAQVDTSDSSTHERLNAAQVPLSKPSSEPEATTSKKVDASLETMEEAQEASVQEKEPTEVTDKKWWCLTGGQFVNRRQVWIGISLRVLRNPVLWGIFWGFVLSLSTLGPTFLNPQSPDFVAGLAWIDATLAWIAAIVSPLSLFSMGVWMQAQGLRRLLRAIPAFKLTLCMLSKLLFVPLVMVGLAKMMRLDNEPARAAVLIATLPISLASFSLGHIYHIGEAVLSANVAAGTLLMLPTMLAWSAAMDALELFPIESVQA